MKVHGWRVIASAACSQGGVGGGRVGRGGRGGAGPERDMRG
jgi:hypothetical protein